MGGAWGSFGGGEPGGRGCDGQEAAALAFGRLSGHLLLPYGERSLSPSGRDGGPFGA